MSWCWEWDTSNFIYNRNSSSRIADININLAPQLVWAKKEGGVFSEVAFFLTRKAPEHKIGTSLIVQCLSLSNTRSKTTAISISLSFSSLSIFRVEYHSPFWSCLSFCWTWTNPFFFDLLCFDHTRLHSWYTRISSALAHRPLPKHLV